MSYATLEDLIARAGADEIRQVADRDRDGVPDPEVVAAALAEADNVIDGYVAAKYALPLAAVPPQVNTWAVSISRYRLHRNGAPDHVEQDYKDAIAALKDVGRGLIALPVAAGAVAPAPSGNTVMASHPSQVFTTERLRGW
ncbi:DUF1320 domain-containing protein [Paracoccaceae bacterium]